MGQLIIEGMLITMKPYIEYANNDAILHAVFLEAIEDISISNDYILLNYRDGDTNTNNIARAGHSSCPILQDVIDELNDWKQKLKSGQTRKYSFSITNSIRKHEKAYMEKLLNS